MNRLLLTDDELIEIEQALIGHVDGCLDEDLPAIESAALKVGILLERPWALNKKAAMAAEKKDHAKVV